MLIARRVNKIVNQIIPIFKDINDVYKINDKGMRDCMNNITNKYKYIQSQSQSLGLGSSIVNKNKRICYNNNRISQLSHPFLSSYSISYNFGTTKLTKQQIESSNTEQQLINKITKLYNYQQYKVPTALALLQAHHQYKLFKPGDWVLDIGAGPLYSWTDLALKLTHTAKGQNKVISNDLQQGYSNTNRQNNIHIVGNFMNQQIRTKIAMNLLQKQLDTILIDATPQFMGNQQADANYTLNIFVQALQFSQRYLKKGGTIVLKIIQSSLSLENQNQAKFFFNQVYRLKPYSFRINSPAFFYIMKGFMMTQNLTALQNLLKQYHKAKNNYSKIQIIQKYRSNNKWDPVMVITNQAKNNVVKLKKQGKSNKDILKIYEDDPFIKAGQIIQLIDILQDAKTNNIQKIKAKQKLLTGSDQLSIPLPKNQQQFAEMIFKEADRIQKQQKQKQQQRKRIKKYKQNRRRGKGKIKQSDKIKVQQKAPLGQNQVYMKSTKITTQEKHLSEESELQKLKYRQYKIEDLYGYNPDNPNLSINKIAKKTEKQQMEQQQIQLIKLAQSFPEVKQILEKHKGDFQKAYESTDKQFRNQFKHLFRDDQNGQQQLLGKKKKKKQQDDWDQQLTEDQKKQKKTFDDYFAEQQDDHPLKQPNYKTKSYNVNKNKHQKLRKTPEMSSQFDFDNNTIIDEKEQQQKIQEELRKQQEAIYANKMDYLTSKPRKSQRPLNSKKNRKQNTHFKHKKKDADL